MIRGKRFFQYILKEAAGFLFLSFGGVYFLKLRTKGKVLLAVLNYHNFSKYNNYKINRGNILDTGHNVNFEKQIKFLKKHFEFSYPEDLNQAKYGINILITFDDGYKDNYDIAFPVLKKNNAKSIFFVVTNFIGTKNWLEHDKLRYLVESGAKDEIEIETLLKKMNQGHSISNWIDKNEKLLKISESRLMMNWNEISDLHQSGFKIGPHTHNHKILSFLDRKDQEREINSSILVIENKLGYSPKYFAFPNGLYNNDSLNVLEKSNMQYCFTTKPGLNTIESNPYLLKRIGINPSDSVGVLLLKLYLNRKK